MTWLFMEAITTSLSIIRLKRTYIRIKSGWKMGSPCTGMIFCDCVFVILNMSSHRILMFQIKMFVPCVPFRGHLGGHIGFSTKLNT